MHHGPAVSDVTFFLRGHFGTEVLPLFPSALAAGRALESDCSTRRGSKLQVTEMYIRPPASLRWTYSVSRKKKKKKLFYSIVIVIWGAFVPLQHSPVYPDMSKLLKMLPFYRWENEATFIASNPSSLNIFRVPHHPQIRTHP